MDEKECSQFLNIKKNSVVQVDKCLNSKYVSYFPWMVYFSSFTANLLLVTCGQGWVWMSPSLPKLLSNDTTINPLGAPIKLSQISTMATLAPVFGVLSLLPSAKISDAIGRKKMLMIQAVLYIVHSLITAFANHIYIFYFTSALGGLTLSGCLVTVPVYNNEIAGDKNRGRIGCIMGNCIPSGILLTYLIGPLTSIKTLGLITSVIPLLHLVFSLFIPESPVYLAMKGDKIACKKSLGKLRNSADMKKLEEEMDDLDSFVLSTKNKPKGRFVDIFKKKNSRKAFFMSIGVAGVQQLSGIFVILAYMSTIFDKAGSVSGDNFGVITGVVQLIFFSVSASVIERLGRRPLLLVSTFTSSVSLFSLGMYFYLQNSLLFDTDRLVWVPIVSVLVYIIGYSLGLGPIPIALVGELFPNDLRSVGVASILLIDNSTIALNMALFPIAAAYFGVYCCMWFYGFSCLLGFIMMFLLLPETKGKSFAEIQEILSK